MIHAYNYLRSKIEVEDKFDNTENEPPVMPPKTENSESEPQIEPKSPPDSPSSSDTAAQKATAQERVDF